MECSIDILVQLDVHILFVSDLLISDLDLLINPIRKFVLQDGGYDIAGPLTADLVDFQPIRHIVVDIIWLSSAELGDLLKRERLIMWDRDVSDVLRQDLWRTRIRDRERRVLTCLLATC